MEEKFILPHLHLYYNLRTISRLGFPDNEKSALLLRH